MPAAVQPGSPPPLRSVQLRSLRARIRAGCDRRLSGLRPLAPMKPRNGPQPEKETF